MSMKLVSSKRVKICVRCVRIFRLPCNRKRRVHACPVCGGGEKWIRAIGVFLNLEDIDKCRILEESISETD